MNKSHFFFLIGFIVLFGLQASAQSRDQGNSREPEVNYKDKGATYDVRLTKKKDKKKLKNSLANDFDQKVEEHHKLMAANAKKNEKIAREMEKPQYSDPTYFGHKNPPKKRPAGKKKFCKECGMKH